MTICEDDGLEIPELTDEDWARMRPAPQGKPGERSELRIDGAVGYAVRLIPSNRVLGCFESTLDAWDLIEDEVDAGRPGRMLALDWIAADGTSDLVSAGHRLVRMARMSNGAPWPGARSSRGVQPSPPNAIETIVPARTRRIMEQRAAQPAATNGV